MFFFKHQPRKQRYSRCRQAPGLIIATFHCKRSLPAVPRLIYRYDTVPPSCTYIHTHPCCDHERGPIKTGGATYNPSTTAANTIIPLYCNSLPGSTRNVAAQLCERAEDLVQTLNLPRAIALSYKSIIYQGRIHSTKCRGGGRAKTLFYRVRTNFPRTYIRTGCANTLPAKYLPVRTDGSYNTCNDKQSSLRI